MNYLIIDDEPIAHTLIENFASEISYMNKVANCYNAIEAVPVLNKHDVDLIFLDINMPKLTGFDFLKTIKSTPQIIIISAHREYALEGYEYNITDYLLKPFNFERFFKAITKASELLPKQKDTQDILQQSIFIKDEKKHHKVTLKNILFIEASGNYSVVHITDSLIMTQMKISDFENLLPKDEFIRVHRSFIISKIHITLLKSSEVHLGDKVIPVGRVYKENMQTLFS